MAVDRWTGGDINNVEVLRRTYVEHYAHIRSKVPKARILEFQSKDGWVPLCEFLGKPVPKDEPYPRVNDAKWTVQLHGYIYYLRLWHCLRWHVGAIGAVLVAFGMSYWVLRN